MSKEKKYSKAAMIGFTLAIVSVLCVLFFAFNDQITHTFGGRLFHLLDTPVAISLFASHIAGYVFSILGLKRAKRKKLKGKGLAIAGLAILVPQTVIIVLALVVLLIIASAGAIRPA